MKHPSKSQEDFFMGVVDSLSIAEEKGQANQSTVLVVKHEPSGPSINVRGPFKLARYEFPGEIKGTTVTETVVDAKWAGDPESLAHLHINWGLVRYAELAECNGDVKRNIRHEWKLSLLDANGNALFWFYLENANHRAYIAYSKLLKDPKTSIAFVNGGARFDFALAASKPASA